MMSFLKRIWAPHRESAPVLYLRIVEKARDPAFYRDLGVPDTVDGRFDMIVIHTALAVRRLREAARGTKAWRLAQEMFDYMIVDFDRSLREMGVGDLSVGKHIKRMGQAWYARAGAYDAGIDAACAGDMTVLEQALRDNLFRAAPDSAGVTSMARYIARAYAHLQTQAFDTLADGQIDWRVPVAEPAS